MLNTILQVKGLKWIFACNYYYYYYHDMMDLDFVIEVDLQV